MARYFEPPEQTIQSCVQQPREVDEGRRSDGLTTDGRQEFAQLQREKAPIKEERETLCTHTSNPMPGNSLLYNEFQHAGL